VFGMVTHHGSRSRAGEAFLAWQGCALKA